MTRKPPSQLPPAALSAGYLSTGTERERLQKLHTLDLLDTPREGSFDDLVELASQICETSMAAISIIDEQRWWAKASIGLALSQMRRDHSFCTVALQQPGLLLVPDAAVDERFRHMPAAAGMPLIHFYAGVPLRLPCGTAIGTLCVMGTSPRTLSIQQQRALEALARQAEALIELRSHRSALDLAQRQNACLSVNLQESTAAFSAFMDNGPFLSYIKDADGRMLFYNAPMAERFGISREAWIGRTDHDIWPAQAADAFREADLAVLGNRTPIESVEVSPLADGTVVHWKSYKFPIQSETGEWMLAGISVDISADLERELQLRHALSVSEMARELEASRSLLEGFLDNSPNLSFIKDAEGRYVAYNYAFAEHFAITKEAWIGRTDHDFLPAKTADSARRRDQQVLRMQRRVEHCGEFTRHDGQHAIFRSVKFPLCDSQGNKLIGGVAVNVTEEVERQHTLRAANRSLRRLADFDSLTGLLNRRVFYERTASAYLDAELTGQPLSVLVLDVDNFKNINDRFGHSAGDEALRLLGNHLRDSLRPEDVVARLGGEEFGVLMPDTDLATARARAGRIRMAIAEVQSAAGRLTVSMGIAERGLSTGSPEHLISQADEAMYAAKRAGKDCILAYCDPQAELFRETAA